MLDLSIQALRIGETSHLEPRPDEQTFMLHMTRQITASVSRDEGFLKWADSPICTNSKQQSPPTR